MMGMRRWSVSLAVCCCLLAALTPAFAHDTTERVNVSSADAEGNDCGDNPSISADGRYVAFDSYADNLVAGDILGNSDVFVRIRQVLPAGLTTVGLHDAAASVYRLRNSNTAGVSDAEFRFGPVPSVWLPIAGDWDGI